MLAYANEGARSPGRRGDGDARRAARSPQAAGRSGAIGDSIRTVSVERQRSTQCPEPRIRTAERTVARLKPGAAGRWRRRGPGHDFTKEYATRAERPPSIGRITTGARRSPRPRRP